MNHLKSLSKDIVAYGVMSGVSKSISFLLLPILAHLFSPAEYGIVDITTTGVSLLSLTMVLSLNSAVARYFGDRNERERSELISVVLFFVLTIAALIFLVVASVSTHIAGLLLEDADLYAYVLLGALIALLTATSSIPEIVLRMERRILHYNLVNITQVVLYILAILLFVVEFQMGLLGVFVAGVFSNASKMVLGLYWVRRYLSFRFSAGTLQQSLRYGLPQVPAVAVTWLNNQADRLILLAFLGLGGVGIFGAAAKISMLIQLLVTIFRQAWDPYALLLINSEERDFIYRKMLTYYIGIMSMFALIFAAFSAEIFALLVPPEYQIGYVIIPWVIGAQILHGSASVTNIGTLVSEKTIGNSIAAWSGAVVNLTLGLLLIPRIGIWGAALGSFASELIFTSILVHFSLRSSSVRFDVSTAIQIVICYVLMCVIFLTVSELVMNPLYSLALRAGLLAMAVVFIGHKIMDKAAEKALRRLWLQVKPV